MVNKELTELEIRYAYDEQLDSFDSLKALGLFLNASEVLRTCDETAYNEGLKNYKDLLEQARQKTPIILKGGFYD